MFKGFSRSVPGLSHIKRNLVCQDSSSHFVGDKYAVAVVADGHGSKKHFRSNVGSKCAVEAALETVANFYENADDFEKSFPKNYKMIIKNMEKQAISVWNAKVNEHLSKNPVTDDERSKFSAEEFEEINPESYYGTTLVVAVMAKDFTFGFQIGDGSLVAVFEDGDAQMPSEYDESAPANITASMCNANAAKMFHGFYIADRKVIALCTSTDGLYTSFGSDIDFLSYHTIIVSQLAQSEDFKDAVIKNITKRTGFGTEDDISFSCVYDSEYLKENCEFLKQKVIENKEKAAQKKAELLSSRKV